MGAFSTRSPRGTSNEKIRNIEYKFPRNTYSRSKRLDSWVIQGGCEIALPCFGCRSFKKCSCRSDRVTRGWPLVRVLSVRRVVAGVRQRYGGGARCQCAEPGLRSLGWWRRDGGVPDSRLILVGVHKHQLQQKQVYRPNSNTKKCTAPTTLPSLLSESASRASSRPLRAYRPCASTASAAAGSSGGLEHQRHQRLSTVRRSRHDRWRPLAVTKSAMRQVLRENSLQRLAVVGRRSALAELLDCHRRLNEQRAARSCSGCGSAPTVARGQWCTRDSCSLRRQRASITIRRTSRGASCAS